MKRVSLLVLAFLLVTGVALGGTYMDRATLLINEARRSSQFLRQRSHDKELARIVHHVAVARLEAAQKFLVHELKADEEERVLRSVFEQHGWPLPKS